VYTQEDLGKMDHEVYEHLMFAINTRFWHMLGIDWKTYIEYYQDPVTKEMVIEWE
jgi:hypothetical protein